MEGPSGLMYSVNKSPKNSATHWSNFICFRVFIHGGELWINTDFSFYYLSNVS